MSKENLIKEIKKNSTEVYRIYEKEYEGYKFIDVRIYYTIMVMVVYNLFATMNHKLIQSIR